MPRRMGRPGLLGLAARTAVVAGTATAVSGGMQRHAASKQQAAAEQQQQTTDQAAAQAQAQMQAQQAQMQPPQAAGPDRLTKLKELGDLKASGVLSDAEFEAEKAKILAS